MSDSASKRGPRAVAPGRARGPFLWLRRTTLSLAILIGGAWLIYAQTPQHAAAAAGPAIWALPLLFFALLCCSAFVSSSETALFSLDKLDLTQMRTSRRWGDRASLRLLDRPNDTLITILILNTFFNIAISLTAGAYTAMLFEGSSALAFTVAAVGASVGILLLGEILPKVLAHLHPQRAARLLAPPLAVFAAAVTPVRIVMGGILRGLFKILHVPEHETGRDVSEEELKVMISSGEVSQVLEEDEREMIDGVFDLRRTVAAEILTPRMRVTAVPDDLGQEEMVDRLRESPNNRVLVYHESLDHLVGFLLVKEVLLDEKGRWRDHLREPLLVPEGVGLLDLLKTFRRQRTKMAVVVDEYGGVAGIVTLQDLLEEIVGDIYEKHEQAEPEIRPVGQDSWRVPGAINLDRLGEICGVTFPDDRGRTVGGFVMNTLGRIPQPGDELMWESLTLTVEKMAGRRLQSLLVRRLPAEAPAATREERA